MEPARVHKAILSGATWIVRRGPWRPHAVLALDHLLVRHRQHHEELPATIFASVRTHIGVGLGCAEGHVTPAAVAATSTMIAVTTYARLHDSGGGLRAPGEVPNHADAGPASAVDADGEKKAVLEGLLLELSHAEAGNIVTWHALKEEALNKLLCLHFTQVAMEEAP